MEKFQALAAVTGFASICGALHYWLRVEEGLSFKWSFFILHCLISGMCGVITYQVLAFYGISHGMAGAMCGLSGWMGTSILRYAEIAVRKRMGVNKEDLK